jgi:transcriptional regulator with GAF, ATPase, and Fis domain
MLEPTMIQTKPMLDLPTEESRPYPPGGATLPTLAPAGDSETSVLDEVLPKTLGRKIHQGLKLITSEAQELAEELRSGLGQYERELLISALEASRRHRSRSPKATLNALPDRLSRRIKRLQLTADQVNSLVGSLVENLKRRLEVYARDQVGPQSQNAVDLKTRLEEFERELVISALEACGMNQVLAAKTLGVLPTTLSEKMKRLGLRSRGRAWRG